MFNNHLMKVCLAAVFAIGLAACSSSSDTSSTTPDPAPAPDPGPTQAEQDLEELQNQIAALRAQLGIDDDDDIGTTVQELQDTLKELQDAAAKMASDAAIAAALALFNGIGETATDLTVAVTAVGDEDGGGGMASVTTTGLDPSVGGDDVMKSAEPMLGGEWQGTMLTDANADDAATNPSASSTVVVYTDIEAPEAVPFGDVYDLDTNGVLANATLVLAANRSKIKASAFTHTGRMNHDPDPTAADDVVMIRGTFNGASGEYRCVASTATACASHDAGDGAVRLEGATWLFDPDSGAMAMMADASYAYFGWWLSKGTTAGAGVEAGVFHGVTDLTGDDAQLAAPTNIQPLGGTATYEGSAAGKYAINPGLSSASGGHWTADATLTADWGAEDAAGMISGMIDNFMSGDTAMDWSVALGETALADAGTFNSATGDPATGDGVVWTIGGVDGAESGAWSGALYAEGDDNVPTVGTGMFNATHGTVGHILGAFGVHLH